jgi:flagellar motor switch/type III secretory pathway protein FliN
LLSREPLLLQYTLPQMTAQAGWQAFSHDSLPRLPDQAARWTATLARARSRIPLAVTIAAKGVGDIEIHPDRVSIAEEAAGNEDGLDGMDYFPLECDGERGWLGVSHRVSLALVRAVLGGPAPAALRPLARGERGVMAAVLLAALDALGISQRVELGLRAPAGLPDPATSPLVVGGSVRTATGLAGRALLLIPVGWLAEAAWTGPVTPRMEGLMANATVELARTDLLGAAVASAVVGDAVVFDGVASIREDEPWDVSLRVGDFVAPACVASGGSLALAGRFSQVEEESKSMASQDENSPRIQKEPSASDVAKVLATAPVEVVAEIGRLTLRGDELAGLMAGGVLGLGPRRTDAIQLRVGGQLWAVGELVSVGDELGVRILRLHAG